MLALKPYIMDILRRSLVFAETMRQLLRHNRLYMFGVIRFTPWKGDLWDADHGRSLSTSAASASRSSTRNLDRPAEAITKGSSGTALVHPAGREARCPWRSR